MAAITKFEDLIAWQEARTLVKMVYKLTSDGSFFKDFGMRDQIQRASVSAMTNIAEGFDCESTAEFARFLGFARRSAVEVQSLLYAALDVEHIKQDVFRSYYEQAKKCKALIGGLKQGILKNPRRANSTSRS
ncbi:MAG TPA: four helix bundle protein [Anaerolineales bacterium]|jgi:four helix bundle protein|nr:four helix bundle protein [Anaerolineales bacterium]